VKDNKIFGDSLTYEGLVNTNHSACFVFKNKKGKKYNMYPSDIDRMFKFTGIVLEGKFKKVIHGDAEAIRVVED
jgi:hypothetical protein